MHEAFLFLFLFFFDIFCFSFFGQVQGLCGTDWPSELGPRRVRFGWLLKQRLQREGEPAFHRGTHTSPNGDAPRVECGIHGRYRFVSNLNPSVLPSTFYPSGSFLLFTFVLSLSPLLFAFLSLVHRRPCAPLYKHTLCFAACLLVLLVPCAFVSPSPPRRSLAPHTPPLQKDSNVFSFGVHLSSQLLGFVSLALVSLDRFVVASPSFWCWCAWRRKEIFWNLSPSGLCACLPTNLSLPRPPPPY